MIHTQPQNAGKGLMPGLSNDAAYPIARPHRLPTGSVGFGSPSLLESNSNLPCKIALPGHSTWATVAAPASQRDLLDARKMRVVSVAS
jgi:hypothetical protein